jgi:tetratricopeptide (TPR) repeat protein
LGKIFLNMFRLDEGLRVLKDSAQRQLKLLGAEHDDLRSTEYNLILVYEILEDLESKEVLLRKHLNFLERQRGPQNRGVLDFKSQLGDTLWRRNRKLSSSAAKQLAQEGMCLMIESYELQLKLHGKESAQTIEAALRLGKCYNADKQFVKAEPLFQYAFETLRSRYGAENSDVLTAESLLAMCIVMQGRATEALEILSRITPILRRQSEKYPDGISPSFAVIVNGLYTAVAFLGLNESEKALETLRREVTERLLQLPERARTTPLVRTFQIELRKTDNFLRDDILLDETKQWMSISGQPSNFKELDDFFPLERPTQTPIIKLRSVKSGYLVSAKYRASNLSSTVDRAAVFRSLRGEQDSEIAAAQGWSCSRCETAIPIADFFYRCYEPSCLDGRYAVCEKCHNTGLTCLKFKHLPHRVKAYLDCNCCKENIKGRYTFYCEICEDGKYYTCKPCYSSGKRCLEPSHHMKKMLQPCYEDYYWYGQMGCDACGNIVEDREEHGHCPICNDNDYDICRACLDLGIKCKDERHELVIKIWRET